MSKNLKATIQMMETHQTAQTQFVEANGIRFAYRRFGKTGGVPVVFNQHYIGTMDYWDPTVTDGLAHDREVILFNNAGVSSSSGEVPTTFEQMGANAIAFIKALGLKQVDLFGFSIGGERSINAVWTYEAPYPAVAEIRGRLAFYPERVDAIEERLEVSIESPVNRV